MTVYLSPGVYVEEKPSAVQAIAGVGTSTAGFIGIVPDAITIPAPNPNYDPTQPTDMGANPPVNPPAITTTFAPAPAGAVRLCTNFTEFTKFFGGFSTDAGQRTLAHAVYGFFNNGGTRCYVVREAAAAQLATSALRKFEAIDEIAIVAAPGIVDDAVRAAIVSHCKVATGDRFAIFDSPEAVETNADLDLTLFDPSNNANILPDSSDYAAFYFPWIQVFDPATKIIDPQSSGRIFVPPSGHVAGIYARVDTQRGVFKAPANEPVLGALGLRYNISRPQQDGLNPQGVNCIRDLNGNIRVWGARTIGGDRNGEWKYVSTRRLFLFLRESIDEGTQWVVFEPNDSSLWAKITRNVTAFLTNVWRSGALFGSTPQEAFYVKCDAETNPPEVRELGQVVTEIGVAVVRPAEFVIFRISQWAGPGQS
jgi:phage tail sheath protein FI